LKYTVLIHEDRESGGYWGECPELPGCFSQGETVDELMEHMKEAVTLYLDESELPEIEPVREIRELVI
jgi:predicted RNase H-like HicB family nuclease